MAPFNFRKSFLHNYTGSTADSAVCTIFRINSTIPLAGSFVLYDFSVKIKKWLFLGYLGKRIPEIPIYWAHKKCFMLLAIAQVNSH